jgi:hypothetical protein
LKFGNYLLESVFMYIEHVPNRNSPPAILPERSGPLTRGDGFNRLARAGERAGYCAYQQARP